MSSNAAPRVALITGGNRGLGKNMVLALARKGISSIFTYNSHAEEATAVIKEVESLGTGAKATSIQLNVTAFDTYSSFTKSVSSALSSWGLDKLDIFIPSAGVGLMTPQGQVDPKVIDDLYQIQFKAPVMLVENLLPLIREKTGVIVTISSGLARFTNPPYSIYSSMKAAIENYTRYLAKEIGPKGIRAICVRVGAVASDFGGGFVRDNENMNKTIAGVTALGRVGLPDDIGPVIASVVDLGWVTGTVIECSGGQSI